MNCVPSVILIQLDTFIIKIPGSAMYIVVTLIRAYISRRTKRTGDEKLLCLTFTQVVRKYLEFELGMYELI